MKRNAGEKCHMKKALAVCILIMLCACGGGGNDPLESPPADLDQILTSPESDLSVEDGVHLPGIYDGTFQLTRIETRSAAGDLMDSDEISPSATITVSANYADPLDTFTARSNLIAKEPIEATGQVSLDLASGGLIVKVLSSNTPSIVEGKTYFLKFEGTPSGAFGISIDATIKGEAVKQVYVFDKAG